MPLLAVQAPVSALKVAAEPVLQLIAVRGAKAVSGGAQLDNNVQGCRKRRIRGLP